MNSSQLNFFILQDDIIEIEKIISSYGMCMTKQVNSIQDASCDNELIMEFNSANRFLIIKSINSNESEIFFDYSEIQNKYIINNYKSNVIQFNRGGFYNGDLSRLHRARLYTSHSYHIGGETINKSPAFCSAAKNIINSIKNKFLSKEEAGYYCSNRVANWAKSNNAFLNTAGDILKIE